MSTFGNEFGRSDDFNPSVGQIGRGSQGGGERGSGGAIGSGSRGGDALSQAMQRAQDSKSRVIDVNNFDAIRISLASPEAIRAWSYGEVTKPETINYRTLKPEHGGLFCERIFGPTRDWECYCGKYKRIRHAGTVCDKCGVEVTRAKVRRERMAHIELAAPVAHIWYVKGTPSRLGLLLDISPRNLERVLYFASYLVTYVDDERKAETVKEIHAIHDETVAEARAEADEKLAALGARVEEKIEQLDEGSKALSQSIVQQHQEELDALKADYKKAKDQIRKLKDYPVKNPISFRNVVLVHTRAEMSEAAAQAMAGAGDEDAPGEIRRAGEEIDGFDAEAAANAAAADFESLKLGWLAHVERMFSEENERLQQAIAYETAGLQAYEGAERDLASHSLDEARKRIEAEYSDLEKISAKERDETIKLLNDVKELNILTETEYRTLQEIVPPGVFKAAMGAEAVYDYVSTRIDLDQLALELRNQMQTDSEVKRKKAVKRLRVVEALRKSGNKPHWMIFTALPVIPPELRPMVQLDGGRFATSDLNDLYRRVINRNNRLKRLLELGAPDIIVRNEKRMLQEAVDALIDNGRRGRVVSGSGKHKLKSLSDMLKGKQGRFRQNLLGKRVDYSGRSVIVVGPNLELDECGLPKRMALELFKPFVMQRLVHHNHAPNIKAAKRLVERVDDRVWEVLEEVIGDHVVLLNRAPTLHRLGIQAFKPKLIEGSAIQIHPLVCQAFNADFDGDQMAVHVPLSKKAQREAKERMLSIRNLLSPSNGEPIVSPTQDIVLGCYYMTSERDFEMEFDLDNVPRGWGKVFGSLDDVLLAYDAGTLDLQAKIIVATDRVPEPAVAGGPRFLSRKTADGKALQWVETTVGRAIFNRALPPDLNKFYNLTMDRKQLRRVVADCYRHFKDAAKTAKVVNDIKKTGFRYSTIGGMSIAVQDVVMSETKPGILNEAQAQADHLDTLYKRGMLTEEERLRELEVIWNDARDRLTDDVQERLKGQNSVWMMADSGAKGNMNQIAQMSGMRGLVLDPQGKIIDIPITSNFREGLTVLEYFIATHGARKGLADTALRTADSGYLTRRLVDVAQDVIITSDDCFTQQGMWVDRLDATGKDLMTVDEFRGRVVGRTLATAVYHPETGELIADRGEEISDSREEADGSVTDMAAQIVKAGVDKVHIRTVMTCESMHGVCALCYGRNLATRQRVQHGEAVGIIAAQSIGEPGTQLTMRTFHTGGVARADITTGLPRVEELFEARKPKGYALLADREGEVYFDAETRRISIKPHERDIERIRIPETWTLEVSPGEQIIENKTVIATSPDGERLFSRVMGEAIIDGDAVVVVGYEPQPIAVEDVEPSSSSDYKDGIVPNNHRVIVENGTFVTLGQPLVDGPLHPQHLLLYLGPDVVQRYIIDEVQKVYKSQGVNTNDKHIEVICRQMLRKVTITYPGDTDYLQDETMRIDRLEFIELNRHILAQGGEPATAIPVLLGITKASLETDSFLSSASFQETTKVLTEAAINGKVDGLRGLKENVIIGKLIPAGSGFGGPVLIEEAGYAEAALAAMAPGTAVAMLEPAGDEDMAELMDSGLLPQQIGGDGIEDAGFQIESGEQ